MKQPGTIMALLAMLVASRMPAPATGDAIAAQPVAMNAASAEPRPPIPIRFTLPERGFVTLVIEDQAGRRVRNLVSETPFAAGENTVWWDGLDESGRIPLAMFGIVYQVQGKLVGAGTYRVRGLWRKAVDLRYEFTPYGGGDPPWSTPDHRGGWLADHMPPATVLFVPGQDRQPPHMLIASLVAESGDGIVWTDLNGRKLRGVRWVGGAWTGASHLTRDAGRASLPEIYAYAGSGWDTSDPAKTELRISALSRDKDGKEGSRPIINYQFPKKLPEPATGWDQDKSYLSGLAAHDGILVAALKRLDQLLFVDARTRQIVGDATLPDPRGLAFDSSGRLLALSGTRLVRYPLSVATALGRSAAPTVIVSAGLEDPQELALDAAGNIYISDRGNSHQVKVFAPLPPPSQGGAQGGYKLLRSIGRVGPPAAGRYDRLHMNNPRGLTITPDGRLWVAEEDNAPKRISVWTLDGHLERDFLGPAQYGGGGNLSPDKRRFYYYMAKNGTGGGMEFQLDWARGTSQLVNVYRRFQRDDWKIAAGLGYAGPQKPISFQGRLYLTNAFSTGPTNGTSLVGLWLLREGVATLVAAAGSAHEWELLQGAEFRARLPQDMAWDKPRHEQKSVFFAWSDLNGDGRVQPDEVTVHKLLERSGDNRIGTLYVAPDLSLLTSFTGRLVPQGFTRAGAPIYDAQKLETLVPGVEHRFTSGGGEAFAAADGWVVATGGPMRGYRNGELMWTYPSQWPGLHASHSAPKPQYPGQMIGTTRLLGWPVKPGGSPGGEIWAINGNQGNAYLMTTDGLFVATLARDNRLAPPWNMPEAKRGMPLNDISFGGEHFWPTINATADGEVYLVAGHNHSSIVRVEGLDSIRRLPAFDLQVTPALLAQARDYLLQAEARRQQQQGSAVLQVALRPQPPVVDGKLDDWSGADRAKIDERTWASLAVAGDRLYAAFQIPDAKLLDNTGESLPMLFKTGGALDLMIGTGGNQRLLVTLVQGKPVAMLYRQTVPGTPLEQRVPFASPTRTVYFDRVEDVTAGLEFAGSNGSYEFSIPLATLGLQPVAGQTISGDVGVLQGNGGQTTQRTYWHNKATAITTDVPSEAALAPQLWGQWKFVLPGQ